MSSPTRWATVQRVGRRVLVAGFLLGLATIAVNQFFIGQPSAASVRYALHQVGAGAWIVAVLVGGPLWVVGWSNREKED